MTSEYFKYDKLTNKLCKDTKPAIGTVVIEIFAHNNHHQKSEKIYHMFKDTDLLDNVSSISINFCI
jgi:hypothetical protein